MRFSLSHLSDSLPQLLHPAMLERYHDKSGMKPFAIALRVIFFRLVRVLSMCRTSSYGKGETIALYISASFEANVSASSIISETTNPGVSNRIYRDQLTANHLFNSAPAHPKSYPSSRSPDLRNTSRQPSCREHLHRLQGIRHHSV